MPVIVQPYRPPESAPFLEDYAYTPMSNSCENFHIPCLEPGSGTDDIVFSLDELTLDCKPDYEAISDTLEVH